jgi:thiol-disulfide isomerase/thioredoxin
MRRLVLPLLVCLLVVAACGKHPKSAAPSTAQEQQAFSGSPPALASLHQKASELVGGGTSAFKQELASLRGHPVVVNKWAAWCGPCRQEFPWFQQLSVKFGKRVAFIGVDSNDNSGDAKGFLKQFPVSYPSYSDPDLKIAALMNAVGAFPTTIFYDPQGKIVATHIGAYQTKREMEQDIARYAR